jgi:hypothetical protein
MVDWPDLSSIAVVAGRSASNADVEAGTTVFELRSEGRLVGEPLAVTVPQYVYHVKDGERIPAVLIPAERTANVEVAGIRYLDGTYGACLLSELELLGTETSRTNGPPHGKTADQLYHEACDTWVQVLDLSIYDDDIVIRNVASILEDSLARNPNHVKAISLLSDLLLELSALGWVTEAERVRSSNRSAELLNTLIQLEPGVRAHLERLSLLQKEPAEDRCDQIRGYLIEKWRKSEDW